MSRTTRAIVREWNAIDAVSAAVDAEPKASDPDCAAVVSERGAGVATSGARAQEAAAMCGECPVVCQAAGANDPDLTLIVRDPVTAIPKGRCGIPKHTAHGSQLAAILSCIAFAACESGAIVFVLDYVDPPAKSADRSAKSVMLLFSLPVLMVREGE